MLRNMFHTVRHLRGEQALWYIEVAVLLAALAFYVYCIVLSVVHVVLRQEYLVAIADTEARVSKLEATYLERSNALTEASAHDLGFVAAAPRTYIAVTPTEGRITRRP